MKNIQGLLNERTARSISRFMKFICYFVIFFCFCGLFLSFIGRQTFILHSNAGIYDNAIYSEKSHDWTMRGPTSRLKDIVYVTTNEKIDLLTQIGLSAMYTVSVIPIILSFWFLGKAFNNVSKGDIFISQNSNYLLYYGLLQIATAVITPVLKLFICYLANLFTQSQISIATGQNYFENIIPNIAFIVAAYIIHHGIHLQDEVEHTL